MPATTSWNPELGIVEVELTGQLNEQDYDQFGPEFNLLIQQHGALRVLLMLKDFKGWTAKGLWEDIKFDYKHYRDIDRLAIVGEKRWHEAMTSFCKLFTKAKVRYFEQFEWDDARDWLTKESSRTPSSVQPQSVTDDDARS